MTIKEREQFVTEIYGAVEHGGMAEAANKIAAIETKSFKSGLEKAKEVIGLERNKTDVRDPIWTIQRAETLIDLEIEKL